MNNKLILTILFCFILVGTVSALQSKIVETQLTIEYDPSGGTTNCVNSTAGNLTTETCTETCRGILKVSGENLLKEYTLGDSRVSEILENNVVREIGNESDITSLVAEMEQWREYEAKYNRCIDSNRNISTAYMMLEEDAGYKNNYTDCELKKSEVSLKYDNANDNMDRIEQDLEKAKSDKWLYLAIGALAMLLIIKIAIPWYNGRNVERDPSEKGFPANAGY